MPMVPDTTPMPKNSPTFSSPPRLPARGTYHSMKHSSMTCTGNQISVIRRCRNRSSSGVSTSALAPCGPVSASSTENSPQEYKGSNSTVHPPTPMPMNAIGTMPSDNQNGRAFGGLVIGGILWQSAWRPLSPQRGKIAEAARSCALRITVGRSPGRKSLAATNCPRVGLAAVSATITRQDQMEMGKGVAHLAHLDPIGVHRGLAAAAIPPIAAKPQHAPQQPPVRPRFHQPVAAPARNPDHTLPHGFCRLWRSCAATRPVSPKPAPDRGPSRGKSRRPGCAVCKWWHQGPSRPGHNRRGAGRASAPPPTGSVPPWRRATAPQPRTSAPSPVPHCHPPPRPARHRRSRLWPLRCRARCPAGSAGPHNCPETRHPAPPPHAHRPADCAPGRNSQAPPIRPSHRHLPPPPDHPPSASGRQNAGNTPAPPPRWFAATSLPTARRGRGQAAHLPFCRWASPATASPLHGCHTSAADRPQPFPYRHAIFMPFVQMPYWHPAPCAVR